MHIVCGASLCTDTDTPQTAQGALLQSWTLHITYCTSLHRILHTAYRTLHTYSALFSNALKDILQIVLFQAYAAQNLWTYIVTRSRSSSQTAPFVSHQIIEYLWTKQNLKTVVTLVGHSGHCHWWSSDKRWRWVRAIKEQFSLKNHGFLSRKSGLATLFDKFFRLERFEKKFCFVA